jgi:peptide/nickel transport system permease protein
MATRTTKSRHGWAAVIRTPLGLSAGLLLLLVLLLAVFAPVLWSHQASAIDTDH